jgi:hypothetical protein
MIEEAVFYKTLVPIYQNTRCYIHEDCNLHCKVKNPSSDHGSEPIIYGRSPMCELRWAQNPKIVIAAGRWYLFISKASFNKATFSVLMCYLYHSQQFYMY